MAFPPQFLDEIRARLTLSDIIGRSVKLTRRAANTLAFAPFTMKRHPPLPYQMIRTSTTASGVAPMVMSFPILSKMTGYHSRCGRATCGGGGPGSAGLDAAGTGTPEQRRAELVDVVEAACLFFESTLWGDAERQGLEYLRGRGLTDETKGRFRLGFAPARNSLKTAIVSNEMPEAMMLEAGLMRRPTTAAPPTIFSATG